MRPELTCCCLGVLLACAGGCAERYDRVAVAGVLVPMDDAIPAAGTILQPLPPMPEQPVPADTADGSVLVAVDQHQYFLDRGTTLPAWAPPHPLQEERDPVLADLRRILIEVRRVEQELDAALPPPRTSQVETRRASPSPSAAPPPVVPPGVLVLADADWTTLVHRIMAFTTVIDHLQVQSRTIGPNGTAVSGLDGDAVLARRQNELWRGLEPIARALACDDMALAQDGSLAQVRRHPRHGPELEPFLQVIHGATMAVVSTIAQRDAPALVPTLRVLEHRIDALEASPLSALAFGMPAPPELPLSTQERLASRLRVAQLRRDLVAIAAQWDRNTADLIDPQPEPVLVYQRAQPVAGPVAQPPAQ